MLNNMKSNHLGSIEDLSYIDPLTETYNRRAFYQFIDEDISEAKRSGNNLVLLLLDIDGFKHINDTLGHAYGDRILKQVTSICRDHIRKEDKVFRIGGDEFAIILKGTAKEALLLIQRCFKEVAFRTNHRITLSGGITKIDPFGNVDIDQIMKHADKALYQAKESGKNMVLVYENVNFGEGKYKLFLEGLISDLSVDINLKLKEVATKELVSSILSLSENSYLYEHSLKVSKLAVLLGRQLNLSERRLFNLKIGSTIYDIGLAVLPERIFLKSSKLSNEEKDLIRHHTTLGGRIIQRVPVLSDILPIVLYHHELINGQGYPYGLPGDYIPLEARIVCVADSYLAMQSDRPYRLALSSEKPISEIINSRGIKYDSQVVDALIRIIDG